MDVGVALIAHPQPSNLVDPGQRQFHHPAVTTQLVAALDTFACNPHKVRPGVPFDRAAYHERNIVERTINRLKQCRVIATRYEKLEVSFHALLIIACILLWL